MTYNLIVNTCFMPSQKYYIKIYSKKQLYLLLMEIFRTIYIIFIKVKCIFEILPTATDKLIIRI